MLLLRRIATAAPSPMPDAVPPRVERLCAALACAADTRLTWLEQALIALRRLDHAPVATLALLVERARELCHEGIDSAECRAAAASMLLVHEFLEPLGMTPGGGQVAATRPDLAAHASSSAQLDHEGALIARAVTAAGPPKHRHAPTASIAALGAQPPVGSWRTASPACSAEARLSGSEGVICQHCKQARLYGLALCFVLLRARSFSVAADVRLRTLVFACVGCISVQGALQICSSVLRIAAQQQHKASAAAVMLRASARWRASGLHAAGVAKSLRGLSDEAVASIGLPHAVDIVWSAQRLGTRLSEFSRKAVALAVKHHGYGAFTFAIVLCWQVRACQLRRSRGCSSLLAHP